jgi:hypothetical protein
MLLQTWTELETVVQEDNPSVGSVSTKKKTSIEANYLRFRSQLLWLHWSDANSCAQNFPGFFCAQGGFHRPNALATLAAPVEALKQTSG